MFIDRAEEYTVVGKANELIFATRRGRSEAPTVMNNEKQGLLQDDTQLVAGDLVKNTKSGVSYFIQAKQQSTEATACQLRKINASIEIQHLSKHFNNGSIDYYVVASKLKDVEASHIEITAKMQQYDLGLLSTTTVAFITQVVDVKLTDRIVFNGVNYIVNSVNTSKYEGLLYVQCAPDNGRVVR